MDFTSAFLLPFMFSIFQINLGVCAAGERVSTVSYDKNPIHDIKTYNDNDGLPAIALYDSFTSEHDSKHEKDGCPGIINCTCVRSIAHCTGITPKLVPENVVQVVATDLPCDYIYRNVTPFLDKSWLQVQSIQLFDNDSSCLSDEDQFIHVRFHDGLKNLHSLKISFKDLMNISANAFIELEQLESLDLSDCVRLRLPAISGVVMPNDSLPNLSQIILVRLGNLRQAVTGAEFTEFMVALRAKRISEINLIGMILNYINVTELLPLCSVMKILNMSHTRILNIDAGLYMSCDSLRSLDFSAAILPAKWISIQPTGIVTITNKVFPLSKNKLIFFNKVTRLLINDLLKFNTIIYNTTILFPLDPKQLAFREIRAAGNNFKRLDLQFVYKTPHGQYLTRIARQSHDFTIQVELLDLSRNGMEYISPAFFRNFKQLRILDLSRNKLGEIEMDTHIEKLFYSLPCVNTINLSSNNLSKIPGNTFIRNTDLHTLDLSNNHMKALFDMTQLLNLQYLDISRNNIEYLDSSEINGIRAIISYQQERQKINKTVKLLEIDMRHNPLQCSCETLDFVKWFATTLVIDQSRSIYTCSLENDQIPLDSTAVDKTMYVCDRPIRIRRTVLLGTLIPLSGIILIILSLVSIRSHVRRRRRKRHIEDLIGLLRENRMEHKYLAFLSYASKDSELADGLIYDELNSRLKRIGNVDKTLVSTDRHFKPGYSIFGEMVRCLKISGMVIALVSNSYCASEWCRRELEQARAMEKPVILMFTEEVDEDLMPPVLRELFRRYVRVQVRLEDGLLNIQPSWDEVCESIITII